MSIFKACDIRGVYGGDLTEAGMEDVGRGFASIMRRRNAAPTIVVGGDVRRSTASLKAALISGLTQCGARVVDVGVVPTPVLYFAFRMLHGNGCAMVTASHNPPKFNGLKLCFSQMPVTMAEIQELRRTVEAGEFLPGEGKAETFDVLPEYETWLAAQFTQPIPLKVVADCGGGSWSEIAPRAMRRAAVSVAPLNCEIDPDLTLRDPNPLPENVTGLRQAVVAEGAAYGAAFDADGDRVLFVDERGNVVPSDVAGAVLARWLLAASPGGKVVYEVNCSQALPDAVEQAGGKPLMERAGHAFMKRRVLEENALLGAEVSGHFFFGQVGGADDGLYSALMMGRLLDETGERLSELVAAVPHYHSTSVVRLPMNAGRAAELVEAIAAHAGGQASRLDGVRVQYDTGWALARASVTEPVISMRFEARRREHLPEILRRFLGFNPPVLAEVEKILAQNDQL